MRNANINHEKHENSRKSFFIYPLELKTYTFLRVPPCPLWCKYNSQQFKQLT